MTPPEPRGISAPRRWFAALVLAALWSAGPSVAAAATKKVKKADQQQALMKIAEYILKNGVDKSIKAPSSRMLGYDVDVLMTKALRQKSDVAPDKNEHSFHVIPSTDTKSTSRIEAIILSQVSITERDGRKHVTGIQARIGASGKLMVLMRAAGFVGDVQLTNLNTNSKEAMNLYKSELDYQLAHIDFHSLPK